MAAESSGSRTSSVSNTISSSPPQQSATNCSNPSSTTSAVASRRTHFGSEASCSASHREAGASGCGGTGVAGGEPPVQNLDFRHDPEQVPLANSLIQLIA